MANLSIGRSQMSIDLLVLVDQTSDIVSRIFTRKYVHFAYMIYSRKKENVHFYFRCKFLTTVTT